MVGGAIHVAPHAGAWIETICSDYGDPPHRDVAPHAGAWIETLRWAGNRKKFKSHPTRVRGLKLTTGKRSRTVAVSHPTRVRGLKQLYIYNH